VQCNVNSSAPIREYLDTLVHPSARADALATARHRAFMAPRLFASLIALGILPVFLALRGAPTVLEFVVLVWMIVPLSTAYFLSRTGRYETAHILSELALTGIVLTVAANSGGIHSFAAIWLVLIPLEAAVSGSRRVVAIAGLLALAGTALLIAYSAAAPAAGVAEQSTVAALGIVSAALYAAGLALGADSVVRANTRLLDLGEEQCRLLAGHMTDVVTRHDGNGRLLFASPNALSVLGATASALRGHGLFDRIHIADRPAFMATLSNAAAGREGCIEFRLRAMTGEATEAVRFLWIEMRCRRFDERAMGEAGAGGATVMAVLRDVSRRKAQEAALIEARAEAEQANAAKSRFLAVMSHELRTPLNAIIGFSEMLGKESLVPLDCRRRKEYAQLINESGYHLLAVVNDVLDMSRLETGDFEITLEPFNLATVMVSCRDLLGLKAQESGVELTCEVPASLPDIVADKRAVKQILINLISNAIKFTDRGGSVRVSAAIDGQHVRIAVDDTGIGIAADDMGRIGRPFFQARGNYARRHDGTGLGLSIVKGLVTLHGGAFEIGSRPGEGTRVLVRLPVDCEDKAPAARAAAATLTDGSAPAPRRRAAGVLGRPQSSLPRLEPASQQRA
jgi:two-component system, cell cycle sensor histidine kinase DivJ